MEKFPGMRAAFPFITIDDAGCPALTAVRCSICGTCYAEKERLACAKCGSRNGFKIIAPGHTGRLHAASIVYRTYPDIPVPFVSAVVDLDGGPSIKGILRGVAFDAKEIQAGRPLKVVFDEALGRTDGDGNRYVSHFFEPL